MPSYGFGRALSSPNPLMVLGQGVMGFGRALYENDLVGKERKHAQAREALADQRYNEGVTYRNQRDAVEDQRHTQAVEEARRNQRFSRALAGYSEVDPVADAGADISEALESTRSYVPTPVPGSLGVGRLLRETAPTYSDGETSFRYDPLMDRGRVQAEELFDRQQGAAREAEERGYKRQVDLIKLQESLRPKPQPTEPSWQVVQTDKGLVQVNPKTGEARPIQVGGQTAQPRPTGAAAKPNPAQAALSSLDNYATLVKSYMSRGAGERGLNAFGIGNAGTVGQLEAAQRAVLLDIKDAAALGALQGPDLELILGLIGDPVSVRSTFKGPEHTLSRLGEAKKYLQGKLGGAPAQGQYSPDNPFAGR